jgi:hypothetical protein
MSSAAEDIHKNKLTNKKHVLPKKSIDITHDSHLVLSFFGELLVEGRIQSQGPGQLL